MAGVVALDPRGDGCSLHDVCGAVAGDGFEAVELAVETDEERVVVAKITTEQRGERCSPVPFLSG